MTSETTTPQVDTFTPNDLKAAVILIDHACEQGAYKGWENIQKAFTVRNRVAAFAQQWEQVSNEASETTPAKDENNNEAN